MSDSNLIPNPRVTGSLMNTNFANSFLVPQTEIDGEKKRFMDELNAVMNELGKSITKMPVMGYRELDLFSFYKEVQAHGGYSQVTDKVGTWSKIWKKLGNFDTSITDASFRLKKNYERFLLEFEYRQYPERRREETKSRPKRPRKAKAVVITSNSSAPVLNVSAREPAEIGSNQKRRKVSSDDIHSAEFVSTSVDFDSKSSPETFRNLRHNEVVFSSPTTRLFSNSNPYHRYSQNNDLEFISPTNSNFDQSPDIFDCTVSQSQTLIPKSYQQATAVTPIHYLERFEPDSSLLSSESLDMTVGEECFFSDINLDDKISPTSEDLIDSWFNH